MRKQFEAKRSDNMSETYKIGNKQITFYSGKIEYSLCLAYSEDICGKNFMFWAETNHLLPKSAKEAEECIENLSWDIDSEGEFSETK